MSPMLLRIDWQMAVVVLALLSAGSYCLHRLWRTLRGATHPQQAPPGCGSCGHCGVSPAQLANSRAAAVGPPGVGFVELDTLRLSAEETIPATTRRPKA
ncbi:MAG: hypothetical protein ACK5F7_03310 [Planctomycetaceae bacterium]|jgi:hypothetical protein